MSVSFLGLRAYVCTMKEAAIRIVLLDDEETLRSVMTQVLTEQGYHVFPFESKLEALEWIEDIEPALVISDLNSPKMDGFQFLQRLRENARTRNVPVIFFTGFNSLENRIAAFELGAEDFLPKSIQFDSHYLFTIVERALRKRQTS